MRPLSFSCRRIRTVFFCWRLCACCRAVRCCDAEALFERIFPFVDFMMRRVIGRFLFFLLYILLLFILLVTVTIVIPYEALYKPPWALSLLILFAVYLTVNIFFHFHKACGVKPGSPAKSDRHPLCYTCQNHKPLNAHHCSICNICVLNMDHHCIWINQCVGADNHRYFFQFLAFVTVGCLTFVFAAFKTFYYNYWRAFTNRMFCDSDRLAEHLPWFDFVCARGPHLVISSVFFTYLLCAIVFLLVGSLLYWNFVLISCGETYLGILLQSASFGRIWRMLLYPHRQPRFRENWRFFLGLQRNNGRTFWRHILLPSSHVTPYSTNAAAAGGDEERHQLLVDEGDNLIPQNVPVSAFSGNTLADAAAVVVV
uniref:Palmitoyltransferase n=1 Tax=Globodera rostochiensis TaxID=31243 RepID=A0A914H0S6_GLORO